MRHIAKNLGLDATTGKNVDLIEALNLQAGDWSSNCHKLSQTRAVRVEARTCMRGLMALLVVHSLIWCGLGWAQQSPAATPAIEEQTRRNVAAPCLEPPPLVRWEDYRGPFQKVVGTLATTLERKAAYPQHYKPGALLCSLEPRDKFLLFLHDSFDPLSFLTVGFNAGLDQAQHNDPTFGQGTAGYAKRFGASFASQTSRRFFTDFAYPTIFSEDPRYYRLAHGSGRKRLLHAISHAFVAHRDNGKHMFNVSEWMGTTTAVVLSNTYHPGNERGFSPAARQVGYAVTTDMGFDILREFWPEIARKLRMPFREAEPKPRTPPSPPGK